jgi:hypothetical protein
MSTKNRCSKLLRRLTKTDRPGLAPAVTELNSENTKSNLISNTTDENTSDNNSTRTTGGQSSPPACSGIMNPPACCCHHGSSEHKHERISSFTSNEVEVNDQTGKLSSRSTLSATVGLPDVAPRSSALTADLDPIYYVDEELPLWDGLVEATITCVPAETQLPAELRQQATQLDVTSDEYVVPGEPEIAGDQDNSGGTPALSEAHHRDPNHVGVLPSCQVRFAKFSIIV